MRFTLDDAILLVLAVLLLAALGAVAPDGAAPALRGAVVGG